MQRINPDHVDFTRHLRTESTKVERKLWQHLKASQLSGARFRRQHPMGIYVLDFACVQQLVAVELDGGQHADRQLRDDQRTAWLAKRGWCVLRFWNNEVMGNVEGVLTKIAQVLQQTKTRPPPQPSPCQGEGAMLEGAK